MANSPYGGTLCDLLPSKEVALERKKLAVDLSNIQLTQRQLFDIELIMNGAFSPLRGFLNQDDYENVLENMRLKNGTLWPIPVTLDVNEKQAENLAIGTKVALRDIEGSLIAILNVESVWKVNKEKEAEKIFGSSNDETHPGIFYLFHEVKTHYVGGSLDAVQLPIHYDFVNLRLTPLQLRNKIEKELSWKNVVAFQTRNPMHKCHQEITKLAAHQTHANILIHPTVGITNNGDIDHFTRVRCYKEILKHFPEGLAVLSLLPLAMRMAGPREAIWDAIIRKNYGASHLIVGVSHGSPGNNKNGQPWYGEYEAQEAALKHAGEIGIEIVAVKELVYSEEQGIFQFKHQLSSSDRALKMSGNEFRRRLRLDLEIPEWFSYPSVVKILRQTYPPKKKQGFTLFFTGLSGAGKSTVSNAVKIALMEEGSRPVFLLDGDDVRTHLSTELGFSKEHRNLNIKRIGYVANQISKAGGIAIIAAIAPYRESRDYTRKMISASSGFFEIYVSTPIQVCEERDVKGLYQRARKGIIKGFTGIDDPYEEPMQPEITLDTSKYTPREAVNEVMTVLQTEGYLAPQEH